MWPHVLLIAVGDTAVCIGTDDDEIADLLRSWCVPVGSVPAIDRVDRVDFGLELHPPAPSHRALPRTIPTLSHGIRVVGRARDIDALRDGLLRTLGSLSAQVPSTHVRLAGLPLLCDDGAVEVASPDELDRVADRWLRQRGLAPIYVPSAVVDPHTLTVRIEAPFGSSAAPIIAPLRRWWCEQPDVQVADAASFGSMMAGSVHRLATQLQEELPRLQQPQHLSHPGPDAPLSALAELVQRMPPTAGRPGV